MAVPTSFCYAEPRSSSAADFKSNALNSVGAFLRISVSCAFSALLALKKIVKAGNRVVFDQEGSFIEDKGTGEKMWFKDEGNMYMLRMWVRKPGF